MLVVLTGGTGGAKLIQGLSLEIEPEELSVICNTADDFILHGLYISPDIDTITYTLAGMSDSSRGWGIQGDTFTVLGQLARYGGEAWFKLGDKDLATHITRTRLLAEGMTLSQVTDKIRKTLAIKATVLPMSDDRVETRIETTQCQLSFQEYFVKERWRPEVKKLFFAGVDKSRPAPGVLEAIQQADGIVVCPSNPISSIGPILAVPGIRSALTKARGPVIGVSPIIGASAITGPAHKLMTAMEMEVSALGVAKNYADFIDIFLVAPEDRGLKAGIEGLAIQAVESSIRMGSLAEKRRLAREVLAFIHK